MDRPAAGPATGVGALTLTPTRQVSTAVTPQSGRRLRALCGQVLVCVQVAAQLYAGLAGSRVVRSAAAVARRLTCVVGVGRAWSMSRALFDAARHPPGFLAGSPQPVLPATGGLLLRPWAPADAPASCLPTRTMRSAAGTRAGPPPRLRSREWLDACRQDWEREKGGHWAIIRDGGEVLGRIARRRHRRRRVLGAPGRPRRRCRLAGPRGALYLGP